MTTGARASYSHTGSGREEGSEGTGRGTIYGQLTQQVQGPSADFGVNGTTGCLRECIGERLGLKGADVVPVTLREGARGRGRRTSMLLCCMVEKLELSP